MSKGYIKKDHLNVEHTQPELAEKLGVTQAQ